MEDRHALSVRGDWARLKTLAEALESLEGDLRVPNPTSVGRIDQSAVQSSRYTCAVHVPPSPLEPVRAIIGAGSPPQKTRLDGRTQDEKPCA